MARKPLILIMVAVQLAEKHPEWRLRHIEPEIERVYTADRLPARPKRWSNSRRRWPPIRLTRRL
jgi:hypothetical protein